MLQRHCLNQKELARRWGISHRTLERWRYTGQGPAFLKLGGRVLYRLADEAVLSVMAMLSGIAERNLAEVDRIRRSEDEIRVAGLAETLVPLVWTHAPGADPDTAALRRLRALGPSWVLSRPDLELPALDRELARCAVVRETAVARLLSCPADAVPSGR